MCLVVKEDFEEYAGSFTIKAKSNEIINKTMHTFKL